MTTTEKSAIETGLKVLKNSKLWTKFNNKEFKLVHHMFKSLETNRLPAEKDAKIFAKLVKKALKK